MAEGNVKGEGHGEVEGRDEGHGEGQIAIDTTPEETNAQINNDLDGEMGDEEDETYNRWATINRQQPNADEETYSGWSTVTPKQESIRGTKGCCIGRCSLKRLVVILTLLSILLGVAVISLSTLLAHHIKHRQIGISPNTDSPTNTISTATKPDMTSTSPTQNSVSANTTKRTIPLSPNSTTTATTTTSADTTTTTTPSPLITTTTTSRSSPTATLTSGSCNGSRLCHSCTSFSPRCPANGTMGNTIEFGMVEQCDCSVPCFSEVRNGREIHRGCVTGKGSIWEEKAQNLDCQPIVNGAFACFCFGYLCNERDMTPYIQE